MYYYHIIGQITSQIYDGNIGAPIFTPMLGPHGFHGEQKFSNSERAERGRIVWPKSKDQEFWKFKALIAELKLMTPQTPAVFCSFPTALWELVGKC